MIIITAISSPTITVITISLQTKIISVVLVRKRTLLVERQQLIGEVSDNILGRTVSRVQSSWSPRQLISVY
jgi:hypothetical protein